jgi:ribosomal protein S18 acetylase RimI-like enzyme
MIDDWYRQIHLRIPFEEWELLPPFAGFKSEYFDGQAVWTPRPRARNAVLEVELTDAATLSADLVSWRSDQIRIEEFREPDYDVLPAIFASSFQRMPPFCTLPDDVRLKAAKDCLDHTRNGGDGDFLPNTSVVASDASSQIIGALLTTRWKPERSDPEPSYDPAYSAHITWVFVHPFYSRDGVGTQMLASVIDRLRRDRFKHLLTTFLSGNEPSMLWHWRNGFRLLSERRGSRKALKGRP